MVTHVIPSTLEEALEALARQKHIIFAGGTDLMVQRRTWANLPRKFDQPVLFISKIDKLDTIEKRPDHLAIGAACTLERILEFPETPRLIKDIIVEMASPGIRHQATLAGNIGNASPAGDSLVGLYLYDAIVVVKSIRKERHIIISDFITGVRKIALEADEMIVEIRIPVHEFTSETYVKVGPRKADAISKIAFAGAVKLENGFFSDIRFAFGAVHKTVVRNPQAESSLRGMAVDELKAHRLTIIEKYKHLISPIDDQRSNKKYRTQVALNLLSRFIDVI